jgi:hypothetical protein
LKKYLSKKLREVEVKIPISKDKKNKCKLDEKQMKLDISRKAVKVLKGKQKLFIFSNHAKFFLII